VGEAWLTGPECEVETGELTGRPLGLVAEEFEDEVLGAELAKVGDGEFPLLVKILFPNDKLSVQVHPDDAMAQRMGQPRGKTECWYVLEAEPGAAVALGMKPGVTAEAMEAAIADGTLEALMEYVPVVVGDMVFVDAGTVHAIGPGVVLLETQQTSDTTFRLFDYGRPRELHVKDGIAATKFRTRAGKVAPRVMDGFTRLIEERYFVVDRFEVEGEAAVGMDGPGCLVGLAGSGLVRTAEGSVELRAGQAVVVPATSGGVTVTGRVSLVRCVAPVG
jgi:mannose-6-phosphate isomerase